MITFVWSPQAADRKGITGGTQKTRLWPERKHNIAFSFGSVVVREARHVHAQRGVQGRFGALGQTGVTIGILGLWLLSDATLMEIPMLPQCLNRKLASLLIATALALSSAGPGAARKPVMPLGPGGGGGYDVCVAKCQRERCKTKKPGSQQIKCKDKAEGACDRQCDHGDFGKGPPIPRTCDTNRRLSCAGIFVWEKACMADGGGLVCAYAANKMRKDSECNLC